MPAARPSLIITTYNRPETLVKVFAGIVLQTRPPSEVIVADDGSEAPTRELVESWARTQPFPVRHVWHPNEGFRRTVILNRAVAESQGDYLIFTDGDCVPHRRFIADHQELAESGCWVQGRRCFVEERWVPAFEAGRTPVLLWMLTGRITGAAKGLRLPVPLERRDTELHGILGCNLAVWREDFVSVNGFDEEICGWGGEDSDLGTRLYHLGRKRKLVHGRAVLFHLNHPAASRDHYANSLARLAETQRSGRIRSVRGLDQHGVNR